MAKRNRLERARSVGRHASIPAIRGSRVKNDTPQIAMETILMLTVERQDLRDGLSDLLRMWDRRDDHGWTTADVKRLAKIRALVASGR